jgi:hypothetical protein
MDQQKECPGMLSPRAYKHRAAPNTKCSGSCGFTSFYFLIYFAVLGFELRAFTLSHSTSPIVVKDFSR